MVTTATMPIKAESMSVKLLGLAALHGKNISLYRRGAEHAEFVWQCYQNRAFMTLYRQNQRRTDSLEDLRKTLSEEQQRLPDQTKRLEWIIMRHEKDGKQRPIGFAAIADYQATHSRGELLIGVVDPKDRTHHEPLETSLLIFDFAFNQLKLHKLCSFVYGYNEYSQKNTLRLGFVQEALLREHLYKTGEGYVDMYQNGMLDSDFRNNKTLANLSKRILKQDITLTPPPPQAVPQERVQAFEKFLRAAAAKAPKKP
jgi:RimJ/RimL family protein N-acetyltransferase